MTVRVLKPVPATSQSRVVFETNRYSIPHLYASQRLTLNHCRAVN
jgi:hypothetical protein